MPVALKMNSISFTGLKKKSKGSDPVNMRIIIYKHYKIRQK